MFYSVKWEEANDTRGLLSVMSLAIAEPGCKVKHSNDFNQILYVCMYDHMLDGTKVCVGNQII